jgi:hypothetical protein
VSGGCGGGTLSARPARSTIAIGVLHGMGGVSTTVYLLWYRIAF